MKTAGTKSLGLVPTIFMGRIGGPHSGRAPA